MVDESRLRAAVQQATETRRVVIGRGAIAGVGELFRQSFPDRPAVVVADDQTYEAAGDEAMRRLAAAGCRPREPVIFPARPTLHADYRHALRLEAALRAHEAVPLAVGSGTINDLTKLAAHRADRPYGSVATAASMDGYASFGASITRDGAKQTMACPAPRLIVADVDILAAAPLPMTASGYADLLGKVTAGADWLVADLLGVEPIQERAWALAQETLREWTVRPERLPQRDPAALERLAEGLIFAGLAMQAARSSRAASGSEHQFSHLWEMQGLTHAGAEISHGFKVGIGSIASAALYERLLSRDLACLDAEGLCRAWPRAEEIEQAVRRAQTVPAMAESAVAQSLAKHPDVETLRRRLTLLAERWEVLRERVTRQLLPAERLRALLRAAGCPTRPSEIGLDPGRLQQSYALARQIRSRYTVFDLAAETGRFDACVEELFVPGGYWAAKSAPG
jgi:glycerol-1-phosphate dehydrogenase [NAD(P)+]